VTDIDTSNAEIEHAAHHLQHQGGAWEYALGEMLRALLAERTTRDARIAELEAELARVRAERDRELAVRKVADLICKMRGWHDMPAGTHALERALVAAIETARAAALGAGGTDGGRG